MLSHSEVLGVETSTYEWEGSNYMTLGKSFSLSMTLCLFVKWGWDAAGNTNLNGPSQFRSGNFPC